MLKKTVSVTVVLDSDFYVMSNEIIFIHTHIHTPTHPSIIFTFEYGGKLNFLPTKDDFTAALKV